MNNNVSRKSSLVKLFIKASNFWYMIVDVFTIIKIDDITYKSTILYELKS